MLVIVNTDIVNIDLIVNLDVSNCKYRYSKYRFNCKFGC